MWVKNPEGVLRGFHITCGRWLQLVPDETDRTPYHTEICRGCGRFMDATAPDRTGTAPIDGRSLL